MFLIEFRKGQFIDGETIQWLSLEKGIKFSVVGDTESVHTVAQEYERTFINNLQAFNAHFDVEACYYPSTLSLCVQYHPEYVGVDHESQQLFFQLIADKFKS